MKKFLVLIALLVLVGGALAQGSYYPRQIATGQTVKSYGGTNYMLIPAVQAIGPAESSDDDQIMAAAINDFNSTTHFVLTSSGVGSSKFLAQPDVPRNIIITMNTTTSADVMITGTDISGAVITENLTWESESGAKAGSKAFKTVTRIDGTTTGNTAQAKIGTGNVLGLNEYLGTYDQVSATYVNGVLESTAATVRKNSTVLSLNTVDTASAPGGYVTLVYYLLKG